MNSLYGKIVLSIVKVFGRLNREVRKVGKPVRYRSTIQDTMQCNLEITASARKGIVKWSKDEYAFFSMQDAFYVYIEKRPENRLGNMSFSIFFDNVFIPTGFSK